MADSLTVITGEMILSFPWLDKPQPPQEEGGKAKFGAVLVAIPENATSAATVAAAKAAIEEAAEKKFGAKFRELFAKEKLVNPLKFDEEGEKYPAGSYFIGARNDNQPGMVYPWPDPTTGKPARVPTEKIRDVFFPGAIVKAQIRAFTYDLKTKKGVSFGLQNIQFIRDGVRLDGRKAAEDTFEVDLTAVPADLKDML